MARPRHRSANQDLVLFSPNTTLGWRVNRRIGYKRGEEMVDSGAAVHVVNELGQHIGYKLRSSEESRNPVVKVSGATSLTITRFESMANAGLMGRSVTARMTEEQKLARVHPLTRKLLAPEDEIELAQEKVKRYCEIGDMKAPRVGTKPQERLEDKKVA